VDLYDICVGLYTAAAKDLSISIEPIREMKDELMCIL